MSFKIFGGIMLGGGIIALLFSIFMFIMVESWLSVFLLLFSVLINVAGITLLSLPAKKKKKTVSKK